MDNLYPVIFSGSILVVAIRPYLWVPTFFANLLPPYYILRTTSTNRQLLLFLTRIIFALYILLQVAISFWIAYTNRYFLIHYVRRNSLDSKTFIMTSGIIIVQITVQLVILTQALTGHQLLRSILINVVQLELDIRKSCTAMYSLCAIRWRLFLHVGIWILATCTFEVYVSYEMFPAEYTPLIYMLSIFGVVLIQMKGIEYCISVQMIQELLNLVQHQLIYLKRELVRCERMELRCSLFAELQANQKLLARVWDLLNQVERYFCIPLCMLFFYNGYLIIQTIHWGYINFELDDLKLRLCRISREV
ncbi:putative gustatory receptor 98b [Bactrocera dorsalis]|uniref:Gustatory receptor n=1 Tax=Bactrocera dorsalis TaxID=27457 RepID=A0ABM3K6S9_BACDO|nr:putative gustatory receptor 98b [Bactrocera dorsalis]